MFCSRGHARPSLVYGVLYFLLLYFDRLLEVGDPVDYRIILKQQLLRLFSSFSFFVSEAANFMLVTVIGSAALSYMGVKTKI